MAVALGLLANASVVIQRECRMEPDARGAPLVANHVGEAVL